MKGDENQGCLHMRSALPIAFVGESFGKAFTRTQLQTAFFVFGEKRRLHGHLGDRKTSGRNRDAGVASTSPSTAAVRARKLMRQKSPAPTKDKRVGKTNRFVPALVEGLAQACLIGDQPQSRHPDELTRQAHLACGWTEEPHRWRLNLRAGSPGVAMSRVDLTNPRRHNPRESTP